MRKVRAITSLNNVVRDKIFFFYFGALACSLLSVFCTFFDEKTSRIAFFTATYFAIAGLVFFRPKLTRPQGTFVFSLFLLGASKTLWFAIEYIGNPAFDIYNSYLATGKRLMLAALLAWFLIAFKEKYQVSARRLITWSLILAFIVASCVGLYQHFTGIDRVDFYQGRATDAAYMYSGLALAVIFMLAYESHCKWHLLFSFLTFICGMTLILLTGTRNVIAAFPLLVMIVGVLKYRHLGWKVLGAFVIALALLVAVAYKPLIKPRLDTTITEFTSFEQTNGNAITSLSTRLSMWRVGMANFEAHPFGISQEARISWFKTFVQEHKTDKASLPYVNIHLHNEVIETASLQGIQGLVALFLFYGVVLYQAWRQHNPMLLSVALVVIVSGLSDVIFISRGQCVFFPLMFIVAILWNRDRLHNGEKAL